MNPILDLVREDDIRHDPWGTAMSWAFGVAEVLTGAGETVPPGLGYRPSPVVRFSGERPEEYPDSEVWDILQDHGADVVEYAGRILARYLDLCRLAGRDY